MSSVVESLNQQLVQKAKELKLTQVTYHYCPRRDFAQRRMLSQYTRKNLDLLEQGPRGIGR